MGQSVVDSIGEIAMQAVPDEEFLCPIDLTPIMERDRLRCPYCGTTYPSRADAPGYARFRLVLLHAELDVARKALQEQEESYGTGLICELKLAAERAKLERMRAEYTRLEDRAVQNGLIARLDPV